jgi:predicted ATPase
VLLVEGEAGVGKSRLIDEFLGYVTSEGVTILRTRLAAEERLPYSAVANVLRPLLHLEEVDRDLLMPLTPLFPELSDHPDLTDASLSPMQHRKDDILAAVEALLDGHAKKPLILYVDDVQRAGAASLELLARLVRRVALVLACRSEETPPEHPLRSVLRPLRQEGRVQELVLEPLAPSHVQQLLFQLAGDELSALSELLTSHTAGNPLFVIATLQHLFERGVIYVNSKGYWEISQAPTFSLPPTVRETIEHRLRGLGPDQRRVFDLVAVISVDLSFALLQASSKMDEERLIDAVDPLIQGGLLIEPRTMGRGELVVAHDRFAEVAYDSLPRVRRRQLHRRVAQALVELHGEDPTVSGEMAYHFHRGGQLAKAAHHALRAGRYAQQLYTGQQAIDHLQNAIKWAEEAEIVFDTDEVAQLQIDLGHALRYVGRYEEALGHFQEAFPIASGELKQVALFHVISLRTTQGAGNLGELEVPVTVSFGQKTFLEEFGYVIEHVIIPPVPYGDAPFLFGAAGQSS